MEAAVFLVKIKDLISIFQVKDVFDILIIAGLIYIFLILFIKTRSLSILIGIITLVVLYGVAFFFNLSLTKMVLSSFFGIFFVVLAIVFQNELRRFFAFLGVLGMKKKIFVPPEETIKTIIKTVLRLAKEKTGAIIVFPGRELIDRHTEGGVFLNGKISECLLLSIFDTDSPGHDGALIIEGDKVKKFAVHLPLSENIELTKGYGTRHRAAVGLSERTDSLSLVVSEEKGTISIIRNGEMKIVSSAEDLEKRLTDFFREKFPQKKLPNYKIFLRKNAFPLAISLGLAVLFWLVFSYQLTNIQRNFIVPVEFRNLPNDYAVESVSEPDVVVTLSGYERDFKTLDPESLKISLDVSEMDLGWHKVLIKNDFIKAPTEFKAVNIEPMSIKFNLTKAKH
jgi:uncharacterized protein (TIGR00159 family)